VHQDAPAAAGLVQGGRDEGEGGRDVGEEVFLRIVVDGDL
jgi:hypothetical protein